MGICISIASSEIHGPPKEVYDENVITFGANKVQGGNQGLCSASAYSKQGTKGLNQDAASIYQDYGMEDGTFCGVFDGHGRNGRIVSNMVNRNLSSLILKQKSAFERINNIENGDSNTLNNHVDNHKDPNNFEIWKEAVTSAFKVMDKEIKLQENLDCSCSGTTAIVVIKQGEGLIIANLGDSRAVLGKICDEQLMAIQLTTDLKPGLPSEAERIRKCNGCVFALKEEPNIQRVWIPNCENSPGLAMSRSFGDFLLKEHGVIAIPDVTYYPLTSSDQFIVLASDGVSDVLSNIEVATIVWTTNNEEEAAKKVVEAANAAWRRKYPFSKIDDCTVVCLFLNNKSKNKRNSGMWKV
ncbi:hypothetical protein PIB30_044502 [Stylosanthes scabra]|uniref:PPM-type phosphatase domain-containing protein n=1 Tax=Stylosanthes scabra TaxID=79078 RepID=A0ABU6YER1_9FABA|nr:hypothetical protein [Stylosanthes scabra]